MRHLTALVMVLTAIIASPSRADTIVLRNFELLDSVKVEKFDEDGVALQGGKVVTWDQIETVQAAPDMQAGLAKMLKGLGEPLYRVRQRLTVGDYEGLLPAAEQLYSRYADRKSPTAYMVAQSLMWGRLEVGRREQAVEPYLRSLELLRAAGKDGIPLPGARRSQADIETGLCRELAPIWFDSSSAKSVLPGVGTAIGKMKRPIPPAMRIYYASLALAAGETEQAKSVLENDNKALIDSKAMNSLRLVLLAQSDIAAARTEAVTSLQTLSAKAPMAIRPLATYWLGVAKTTDVKGDEQLRGLLDLLRVPAVYGKQSPDLAAAGLHRAMVVLEAAKDLKGSIALRRELLENYGQTYHAAKLKSKLSPAKDP